MKKLLAAAVFTLFPAAMFAQARSPDEAKLVTSDIANFWRAIDMVQDRDSAKLVHALRDEYLAKASPGLADFAVIRIADTRAVMNAITSMGWDRQRAATARNAAPGTPDRAVFDSVVIPIILQSAAEELTQHYLGRRAYYEGIRPNTLSLENNTKVGDAVRASFRRMKELYPEATFADVYFVIGRMNSGGTISNGRLLIGAEIYGRDASTPLSELNAWEMGVTGEAKDLPSIVAHEYAHTLQARRDGPPTLLSAALGEGIADFIAELISGSHIVNPAYAYGDANEAALWAEFQTRMDSSSTDGWFSSGAAQRDRPADLGYWMGYRIAKAYYERATDKKEAVRAMLNVRDARAFFEASGYLPAERLRPGPQTPPG
jgi:hypothetical protein